MAQSADNCQLRRPYPHTHTNKSMHRMFVCISLPSSFSFSSLIAFSSLFEIFLPVFSATLLSCCCFVTNFYCVFVAIFCSLSLNCCFYRYSLFILRISFGFIISLYAFLFFFVCGVLFGCYCN